MKSVEPGAEDAAGRKAEHRLHHLIAGVVGIHERVDPVLYPDPDVFENEIRRNASRGEQH